MNEQLIIDAFKEGKYPQGTFGPRELAEVQQTYDPSNYEAPITIEHVGHPVYQGKKSIPAFGWIGAVHNVGGHLKLVVSQFSEQLKGYIKDGFYKKVSIAFYDPADPSNPTPGKWHLHHLAFLGGNPPQVKGLEGIAFAEMSFECVSFGETEAVIQFDAIQEVEKKFTEDTIKDCSEACANFMSKLQNALNSDIDEDTRRGRVNLAFCDLDSEMYNTIGMHFTAMQKLENLEEHAETEMSEKNGKIKKFFTKFTHGKENNVDATKEKEYQDKIIALEIQNKEFAEKERIATEAQAKADAEALKAKNDAADETLRTEIKTFCEDTCKTSGKSMSFIEDLKIPDLMFGIAKAQGTIEFGEGDKKENKTLLAVFQDVLTKLPGVQFGEMPGFENKSEAKPRPMLELAKEYVQAHHAEFAAKGMSDVEALSFVIEANANDRITLAK